MKKALFSEVFPNANKVKYDPNMDYISIFEQVRSLVKECKEDEAKKIISQYGGLIFLRYCTALQKGMK